MSCSSFLEDRLLETRKSSGEPYEHNFMPYVIAFFRRRFADSLKQGQPRIRCAGKESCRRGWLEATRVGGTEVTSSMPGRGCQGERVRKECLVAA